MHISKSRPVNLMVGQGPWSIRLCSDLDGITLHAPQALTCLTPSEAERLAGGLVRAAKHLREMKAARAARKKTK